MENLKIGLVRRGYSPTGGAEAYLLRLAAALRGSGAEVTLYTSEEWPEEAWVAGELLRLDGSSPQAFSGAFVKRRKEREAKGRREIILSLERVAACDFFRAGDGVHASWLQRRRPYESWLRRFFRDLKGKHRELLELEQTVFGKNGARHVIANSEMVKREILEIYADSGWTEERVTVVRNGFDALAMSEDERTTARREIRESLGTSVEQRVILFTGSGWERKGLRFAIEAVEQMGDVELWVAGRGRNSSAWRNSGCVRFLGSRKDIPQLCCGADVFVLPTLYDPSSNACLEALAYGLPVVTTQANGFSELLEEGKTGSILDKPEDVAELAGALSAWCDRMMVEDLAGTVHQNCAEQAAKFSVERNLRETLAVLVGKD